MQRQFGSVLKDWRGRRRMSQLDLGLEADVSTRHISFLESGRAKPSRKMVMHLAQVLAMPREASNTMLVSAGFAPAYEARRRDAAELKPLIDAINRTIARHEPYPAFVLDRHWVLKRMNRPAVALFAQAGLAEGQSLLDALVNDPLLRDAVVDIGEMLVHVETRLRTEIAHLGGDEVLEDALRRIEALPEYRAYAHGVDSVIPAVIPIRYRAGEIVVSLFSTIAQFGSAEDMMLADWRIEMLFPADEQTRAFFQTLSAG